MLNEGIIFNDAKTLMKSEMLKHLWAKKRATVDDWERSVFKAMTGKNREDVDWEFEDNQAGYYAWVRTFDGLITELIDDGYVREEFDDSGKTLVATEADPGIEVSFGIYPSRPS